MVQRISSGIDDSYGQFRPFGFGGAPCQCRDELCLPIVDRLVGKHDAVDQEDLNQISQTEFVDRMSAERLRRHVPRVRG
jgi:hypothetical protein